MVNRLFKTALTRWPMAAAAIVGLFVAVAAGCTPVRPKTANADFTEAFVLLNEIEHGLAADTVDVKALRALTTRLQKSLAETSSNTSQLRERLVRADARLGRLETFFTPTELEVRFYSGLRDVDASGTPDVLAMAVTPKDRLHNAIKTPGDLKFELCRRGLLGRAGQVMQAWEFACEDVETHWKAETVVFPAYEFALPLSQTVRESLAQGPFVARVTFTPVVGEPLTVEYVIAAKVGR